MKSAINQKMNLALISPWSAVQIHPQLLPCSQMAPAHWNTLYEAVIIGEASAVLAASIFHFGEIRIPEAKAYLKSKGIKTRD